MTEIKEGAKAPRFKLQDKDGKSLGLGTVKEDFTVLYFYPKDDTPGCTIEALEFSKALKEFKARKAAVIGVSGGDLRSKAKFCSKHRLSVPLVSDSDFKVSRAYGAYGTKKFMGRSFKGIHRKTFIIDKNGVVVRAFETVKPEGHAEEVLKALDSLRKGGKSVSKTTAKSASPKKTTTKKTAAKKTTAKKSGVKSTTAKRTTGRKAAKPARRAQTTPAKRAGRPQRSVTAAKPATRRAVAKRTRR